MRLLLLLLIGCASAARAEPYLDFNRGQDTGGEGWVDVIRVTSPDYRSDIAGDTTITFTAPGMTRYRALCWQIDEQGGHDELLAKEVKLDDGKGSFVFPAATFPHGPTNIRILTTGPDGSRDLCELQLYNTVGTKGHSGIPDTDPAGAEGMTLVFRDDFDGPLSISRDGKDATYNAHKPRFGDFSGWPFADPDHANEPVRQRDSYLNIAARKPEGDDRGSTGLIATVAMDGTGFWANPPFYAEVRMTAQSAPGTWPAFWTITALDQGSVGDELDIVEAYGGLGKGNPNHPGYSVVGHFWNQKDDNGQDLPHPNKVIPVTELGNRSYFSTTFHTYGLRVGGSDTVYYYDDLEVFRHPTGEYSKNPHCLLINYAIGGISGWKIDLERYDNGSDLWIDYLRVYQTDPAVVREERK